MQSSTISMGFSSSTNSPQSNSAMLTNRTFCFNASDVEIINQYFIMFLPLYFYDHTTFMQNFTTVGSLICSKHRVANVTQYISNFVNNLQIKENLFQLIMGKALAWILSTQTTPSSSTSSTKVSSSSTPTTRTIRTTFRPTTRTSRTTLRLIETPIPTTPQTTPIPTETSPQPTTDKPIQTPQPTTPIPTETFPQPTTHIPTTPQTTPALFIIRRILQD